MSKKGYNYFDKFLKNSNYAVECAKMLEKILLEYSKEQLPENMEKMHEIEQNADYSKHEITNYLLKDFLPPLEREDIMTLCDNIDEIIDLTEEILVNLEIFNVEEVNEDIIECGTFLVKCCNEINELTNEFKNLKKTDNILKRVIRVNELESEGDILYRKCMKNLYNSSTDPVKIMSFTKIIIGFENCFDACEDVANVIENIVLKNS